jgi:hypothetical protein
MDKCVSVAPLEFRTHTPIMGLDVSPIPTFFITPSLFPFFGNGSTFLDGSTAGNATIDNSRLPKFSGTSTASTATIGTARFRPMPGPPRP